MRLGGVCLPEAIAKECSQRRRKEEQETQSAKPDQQDFSPINTILSPKPYTQPPSESDETAVHFRLCYL